MSFRAERRCKREMNKARASSLAWILRRIASEARSVHAPATLWLFHLIAAAPDYATSADDWPKSPEELARTFAELSEGLLALGVIVSRKARVNRGPSSPRLGCRIGVQPIYRTQTKARIIRWTKPPKPRFYAP